MTMDLCAFYHPFRWEASGDFVAAGQGRTASLNDTDRQPPGYTPRCAGIWGRKRALQTLLCLPIRCPDSESECVSFLLPTFRKVVYADPKNYPDRGVERALYEHSTTGPPSTMRSAGVAVSLVI